MLIHHPETTCMCVSALSCPSSYVTISAKRAGGGWRWLPVGLKIAQMQMQMQTDTTHFPADISREEGGVHGNRLVHVYKPMDKES